MMSETSYYHQGMISARPVLTGKAGSGTSSTARRSTITRASKSSISRKGQRTWRHGMAPMHYPTHSTAMLIGLTGERLTEVACIGWGDGDPILRDNAWRNPFWNATALSRPTGVNAFRVAVYWKGAMGARTCPVVRRQDEPFLPHPNGVGPVIRRTSGQTEKDSGGFVRQLARFENTKQPKWWNTDMLPAGLHHDSYHDGSHTFLTHEFITALIENRRPRHRCL